MRKKAKREYEKKLLKRFKDKPKLFYSYVRNKQKVKPEIPQLKGHCIEFKYYADGIHSGLTPPG